MNIAVLISGSGRSLKNLFDLGNKLNAKVKAVIGSKKDCPGFQYVPDSVISFCLHRPEGVYEVCERSSLDISLICMAGWLHYLPIPDRWQNRVMNIHPSLLPAFGGKGMYGNKVHKAVIESGAKFSGCTVHFANNEYDRGPIILQRLAPVLDNDTPETLAARVFEEEKLAYPAAINLFSQDRLQVVGNRVLVK